MPAKATWTAHRNLPIANYLVRFALLLVDEALIWIGSLFGGLVLYYR